MSEAGACELEHPGTCVDSDDSRTGAFGDVVRELPFSAADIEHALARLDALDEEVVVTRKTMLRVHALVVGDRAEVDSEVCVFVDLQQFAHRLALVGLSANRAEPEAEERTPQRVREKRSERAKRDASSDTRCNPSRGPGAHRVR